MKKIISVIYELNIYVFRSWFRLPSFTTPLCFVLFFVKHLGSKYSFQIIDHWNMLTKAATDHLKESTESLILFTKPL